MARKRPDNKKWRSRPSRKKVRRNRNTKPCKIRKKQLRLSKPTKLSQEKRSKVTQITTEPVSIVQLEEQVAEEVLDAKITHDLLADRYR
jgi:hypothetical protein